jgi:hypothetical protein
MGVVETLLLYVRNPKTPVGGFGESSSLTFARQFKLSLSSYRIRVKVQVWGMGE